MISLGFFLISLVSLLNSALGMKLLLRPRNQVQNSIDNPPQTLIQCIYSSQFDLAHDLIKNGADVNEAKLPNMETPLMIAALHANIPLMETLLSHNANLEASDATGRTALFYPLTNDEQLNVVKYLVEK